MITKEYSEAYAEIDEILGYLPEKYINKIPVRLREFYKKAKDEEYVSKIDPYKTLDNQDIKPKTKTLLTIIYREYWCSEEEREELDKILIENDKKYEAEIRKKYNPDNLFKKRQIKENRTNKNIKNTDIQMVEYKKNFYTKFINWLKKFFKK